MRFLFFIFFVYILLKWFRGFGANNNAQKKTRQGFKNPYSNSAPPRDSSLIDEMKKCPSCGTYNPTSIALRRGSEYFCDTHCLK